MTTAIHDHHSPVQSLWSGQLTSTAESPLPLNRRMVPILE